MVYVKFTILEQFKDVVQAVSTRAGGMSTGTYATLNLGFHTDDDADKVLLNREILCNELHIPLDCLVCAKQVHGGNVTVVKKDDWGKGSESYESAIEETDAMITDTPGIFPMILVADCPGIVFFDRKKKVAGVAHAGWRSTLVKISQNVVGKMREVFKSKPEDILCGISPSIGPCCYEVKEDVVNPFVAAGLALPVATQALQPHQKPPVIEQRDGKFFLNLWEINRRQLVELGIREENIEIARLCSSCYTNLFFSVRKEGKTGRYGVLIGIRK